MNDVTLNLDGLNKLLKAIKKKSYIKVGILGDKDRRKDGKSNSEVGAAHEFGTSVLPQRSFLNIPLRNNFSAALSNRNVFTKEDVDKVFEAESLEAWNHKLGILGVGIVLKAFDEQGPGWAALKEGTLKEKARKNLPSQILTATQQLRGSITYDVVNDGK